MIETSDDNTSNAFSSWLRTGKLPPPLSPNGLELKFNPWHDPKNGRFAFTGAGQRYSASGADTNRRASTPRGRVASRRDHDDARTATRPKVDTALTGPLATDRRNSAARPAVGVHLKRSSTPRPAHRQNPVTEFAGGVGEGLYAMGKETVAGVHAALTTNPATTLSNISGGAAGMIDAAIAAEDTPARVQVSLAASAVANASARDIGHVAGTVAGNVALAAVPGAALSKATALRRLRMARPRPSFPPPQIGWVKEVTKSEKPWKPYNDSAPGARAGQAPTLMRTMPDGSKRPVKFDGFRGDYVIDRKWSVSSRPRSKADLAAVGGAG